MPSTRNNILNLETTKGRIVIEMRPDLAPRHVTRIKQLVREGFYDGIVFHRVIDGFMAQTGCPNGTGTGGSGKKLKAEFNNEPHVRGTVSMARAASPDSGDSQFFICFDDATFLDGQYTVWGKVTKGMEIADKIKRGEPVQDPDRINRAWIATDLSSARKKDKRKRDDSSQRPPDEPRLEAGPTFSMESGKIDLVPGIETTDAYDRTTQLALQRQIVAQLEKLQAETVKVGNRYPNLAQIVEEYTKLVRKPLVELDVVSLWAVGSCLLAHAYSFEQQDLQKTLTEPLEPSHLAVLASVARLHGGFILGFPKGRELTERSDLSQLTPTVVELIIGPTSNLLSSLSKQGELFSARARKLLDDLNSSLLFSGWHIARVGYISYATVRNCLIELGKALIWCNDKGGSVVGGVLVASSMTASGVTGESILLACQFLHSVAGELLSFAAPFPELHAWIRWIIDHFDQERIGGSGAKRI